MRCGDDPKSAAVPATVSGEALVRPSHARDGATGSGREGEDERFVTREARRPTAAVARPVVRDQAKGA